MIETMLARHLPDTEEVQGVGNGPLCMLRKHIEAIFGGASELYSTHKFLIMATASGTPPRGNDQRYYVEVDSEHWLEQNLGPLMGLSARGYRVEVVPLLMDLTVPFAEAVMDIERHCLFTVVQADYDQATWRLDADAQNKFFPSGRLPSGMIVQQDRAAARVFYRLNRASDDFGLKRRLEEAVARHFLADPELADDPTCPQPLAGTGGGAGHFLRQRGVRVQLWLPAHRVFYDPAQLQATFADCLDCGCDGTAV